MANEKELKDLTQEEFIEKIEKLESELKDARNERDIHKRMYDRLYTKVRTIQNIIEL
jgi:ribosomal protein L19E